ncbi:MAG: histone deacetylase family protein [Sulfolobales archaeon]|nr:histone deacetylase family protein [Sulfolobales archaeon]
MSNTVNLIYSDVFRQNHSPHVKHPENPGRMRRVLTGLARHGLKSFINWHLPIEGEIDEALKVHVRGYVNYVKDLFNKAPCEIDPDTYVSITTLKALKYSIGTVINYSLKAYNDRSTYFAILRPPGHHVGRGGKALGALTQGFCIFNNIALAASSLIEHGISGILIVDFDAHHGNGTQEIFYETDQVMLIDIHQDPRTLYPFTGHINEVGLGRGEGYNVNIVLPPLSGDDVLGLWFNIITDLAKQYDPEVVLVSAGFDGYVNDGLTELRYTSKAFYRLGKLISSLNKPTFIVLEGGYSVGLEEGLPAFTAALASIEEPMASGGSRTPPAIFSEAMSIYRETITMLSKYWRVK